jgi:hypothetical protein
VLAGLSFTGLMETGQLSIHSAEIPLTQLSSVEASVAEPIVPQIGVFKSDFDNGFK